jgi:hypothetical protein
MILLETVIEKLVAELTIWSKWYDFVTSLKKLWVP